MNRRLVTLAAMAALFAGAFIGNRQLAGPSPIAWFDTINDEHEVRQCVVDDSCTLIGMGTSIAGLVHGVAWIEMRSLLEWLGPGLEGAHLAIQIGDAAAVVLVFHLAMRLGGALAGAAAVWIYALSFGSLGVRSAALYNSSPLPFLGAVLLLACAAVVQRPGFASVALAALVAAVMANVHLACILTGASVVWVALLAPRRRWSLAAFGAVLFTGVSFAVAPPSWLQNVAQLFQHRQGAGSVRMGATVADNEVVYWVRIAIVAWAASFLIRTPAAVEYRRRAQSALAVTAPFLAAFFAAPHFGVDANMKYLAHLKAASAVGAALPVGLLTASILRERGWLVSSIELFLPFALALLVARPAPTAVPVEDETAPTIGDLTSVTRILRERYGWSADRVLESLKAPQNTLVLSQIRHLEEGRDDAHLAPADANAVAVLLSFYGDELPRPLPANWTIVRRSPHVVAVLIVMPSRIDWHRFEICTRRADVAEPVCAESGLRFERAGSGFTVPDMPPGSMRVPGVFRLRLPLRPPRAGSSETVFMPRMPDVCGGRIVAISDAGSRIDPDGRRGALSSSLDGGAVTIEVEWDILSADCDGTAYDGMPPFFLEGDAEDVGLLERILRDREDRDTARKAGFVANGMLPVHP